ncbi:MAG: hypothetical protein ACJA16_004634, partial [Akkermansiaceae bacterium]
MVGNPLPIQATFRIPITHGVLYNLDHDDHAPPPVLPKL